MARAATFNQLRYETAHHRLTRYAGHRRGLSPAAARLVAGLGLLGAASVLLVLRAAAGVDATAFAVMATVMILVALASFSAGTRRPRVLRRAAPRRQRHPARAL